jgi:hypothetical protein
VSDSQYVRSRPLNARDPSGLDDNVCNPADAPGDIMVCRDNDGGPLEGVPECVFVSPGKCARSYGEGDWEFVWIPFGPNEGWYYCDSNWDCDPTNWNKKKWNRDGLNPVFPTPYRRIGTRPDGTSEHGEYLREVCSYYCEQWGAVPCSVWQECMNNCMDNGVPSDPDTDIGTCPYPEVECGVKLSVPVDYTIAID